MSLLLLLVDVQNKHIIYNNTPIDNSLTSVNAVEYDELSTAEEGVFGPLLSEADSWPEAIDANIPKPLLSGGTRKTTTATVSPLLGPHAVSPPPTPALEGPEGFSGAQFRKSEAPKQPGKGGAGTLGVTGGTRKYRKD